MYAKGQKIAVVHGPREVVDVVKRAPWTPSRVEVLRLAFRGQVATCFVRPLTEDEARTHAESEPGTEIA